MENADQKLIQILENGPFLSDAQNNIIADPLY